MRLALLIILLPASLAASFPRPAIDSLPEHYLCSRIDTPLIIDGVLDEPAWAQAGWTRDFVDIEGVSRPAPRWRTRVKMIWDERYFYIAAEMEEPHLWATLHERDSVIFMDNDFEVFIDPDGDNHDYYELEINALGTEWDLFLVKPYRDGGPALHAWDIAGLETAVALQGTLNDPGDRDIGWTVEIALPWSVLSEAAHRSTPPNEGDQWRINFSRVEWDLGVDAGSYFKLERPEHNWVWSPQGLINMHYPERWGFVQFGGDSLRTDPDWPQRHELMKLYYAQREYRNQHGRFAGDIAALNWPGRRIQMQATASDFEAVLGAYHIDGSSHLWKESP